MLQPTHDALQDEEIPNDAFYGDLNLKDFQERYRIPADVAPITIKEEALLPALDECNEELLAWKADQEAAGVESLEELDTATDPTGAKTRFYREAVFARAYGYLIPMLITLYFTDQADGLEDDLGQNEGRFFRRSEHFLNRLMGRPVSGDVAVEAL